MKLLTTSQAVFIGLASMLGAGVFVVFGPAAAFAGGLLPLAVLLAATVAYLNAQAISKLARVVTRSGGAYSYARHYIGETAGFVAGSAFLIGKLGSVAAIALTVASHLGGDHKTTVAVLAIALMTLINVLGINRTALGATILASVTSAFLVFVLFAALTFAPAAGSRAEPAEPFGVLTAAAMLFFAFAGYARVATLGGEVRNPKVAIPRAIGIALGVVLLLYMALALVLQSRLGAGLGSSTTPVADVLEISISGFGSNLTALFAAVAALGSLLALLAGMGRTAAVMGEDHELPASLASKNSFGAPWLAELLIALLSIFLVLTADLVTLIGLSSFAVLVYYAIANLAAAKQSRSVGGLASWSSVLGLILCCLLALAVPVMALILGVSLLSLAAGIRWGLARVSKAR